MLSFLSEKVDEHYGGFPFKYTLGQFIWAILRSIGVALSALITQLIYMGILLVPAWVAGEMFFKISTTILTSFFLGFAFFDYSLERYKFDFASSWQWFFGHLHWCFFIGLILNLFTYLPLQLEWYTTYLVGMGLLPPALTIFATMIYIKRLKEQ